MRYRFFLLLFLQLTLFSADFDCILVGTSPFSLFEALYQHYSGKKVLILEAAAECGGAWKSISICGIPHADLGCHQIGADLKLKQFLEEYAGCKIVSMDSPALPFEKEKSPNGYYFSKGCFELVDHLLERIRATDIVLLTQHRVVNVSFHAEEHIARVETGQRAFTTEKLILTPMSDLPLGHSAPKLHKSKYYHLYLLIQDPTPPLFTYKNGPLKSVSRTMNLTPFVDLAGTGRQLILLQTHSEEALSHPEKYVDELKEHHLLDPGAYLLKSEPYIYESGHFNQSLINQMGAQGTIELLQTGHFQNLTTYIDKWKTVLPPYL